MVLVGASGSGKSTWAAAHYRRTEIVSSDDLRGIVGTGPHDLDASADAFDLLERIVAARLGRGLTTVVDTLGLDEDRRTAWLAAARAAGLPAVAVLLDTPPEVCRARNRQRVRPVPAPVVTSQLRAVQEVRLDGWDLVHRVTEQEREAESAPERTLDITTQPPERRNSQGLRFVLQVGRFPWGDEPAAWLSGIARAADDAGFAGLALMDHLIQIPQVGRAWEPIPEPWVTLGLLAGLDTGLELGTLVTPVTFRPPGITAKAAATLDALSGGRAFVGIGAGWWSREHAAYDVPFPPPRERVDAVERAISTMRALWAPGTKPAEGLPETTCYPRPEHEIAIIVGGSGARMIDLARRRADAVNVRAEHLDRATRALRGTDVRVTVLDVPSIERDLAGPAARQRDRYGTLADRGADTIFLAPSDLRRPEDLEGVAALLA